MSLKETLDNLKQYEVYLAGPSVAGVIVRHDLSYHFFTAEAPRLIDDLHSHKRSFTSHVEYGAVRNHIYEIRGINPVSGKKLVNINCEMLCGKGGCASHKVVHSALNVVKVDEITTKQGESYSLAFDQFHKLELASDGPVITRLHWSRIMQPNTQIIVDNDYLTNKCCAPTATEDELWEMVKSCLAPAWEKAGGLEYDIFDGKLVG